MSIEVTGVSKKYGEQLALNDVSFNIQSGNIVGFLGPNGAGKSTMMKIISCYLPQTSGEVKVCGYDVVAAPLEVKSRVGYLPEHNPLYPDMYVREYLEFIGGIHKISNKSQRVNEMIERVGLTLERKKKIGALSKGYRQRVGLAQAMIHDPEVLILDEPTTGLDPNQIVEIRNLIKNVGREKTVLLSTHIMQEVDAICDRVIIVNHGKIVANDKSGNLKSQELNQVVKVEFDKKVAANLLKAIKNVSTIKKVNETTWLIASDLEADIRPSIFEFAVKANVGVLTIQKEESKLEDVFKRLTKD